MSKLKIMLATNCTASQSVEAPRFLTGADLPRNMTAEQASREWKLRLERYAGVKVTPLQLYRGISFHSVVRMLQHLEESKCWIISIGQGLVQVRQPITPYDLSVDPVHQHSLAKVITEEVFSPELWWANINNTRFGLPAPLCERFRSSGDLDLLIVCCSSRFLGMVSEDLLQLVGYGDTRLRIVTTSFGGIPNQLKPYAIRYDRRLSLTTIGNRNDSNQRAALHFLKLIRDDEAIARMDVSAQQQLVDQKLQEVSGGRELPKMNPGATAAIALLRGRTQQFKDPDEAYSYVRRSAKIMLTPGQFKMVWRAVHEESATIDLDAPIVDATKTSIAKTAAMSAMTGIMSRLSAAESLSSTMKSEDSALELLTLFVDALREMQPDAKFGSADVYAWLGEYKTHAGIELPRVVEKIGNVARLLKANMSALGIEAYEGGIQGARLYRLSSTEGE